MNASSPITRTAAGVQELAVPSHGLSLTQRRVLTLLDTPGSLSDLQARTGSDMARLERDLARLVEIGLVDSESTGSPMQPGKREAPVATARPAASRRSLGIAGAVVAIGAATIAWMGWPYATRAPAATAKPGAAVAAVPVVPMAPVVPRVPVASASDAAAAIHPAATDLRPTPPAPAALGDEAAAIATTVLDGRTALHLRDTGPKAGRADPRGAKREVAKRELAKRGAPIPVDAGKTATPSAAAATSNATAVPTAIPTATPTKAPGATTHPIVADAATHAPVITPTDTSDSITPTETRHSITPVPPPAPAASAPMPTEVGHAASSTRLGDAAPPLQMAMAAPPAAATRPAPAAKLTPLVHDAPRFPREALRRDIDRGMVRARLTIDAQGKVSAVAILEASPHGVFEGAVRSALSHWKFAPGGAGRSTDVDVAFKRD